MTIGDGHIYMGHEQRLTQPHDEHRSGSQRQHHYQGVEEEVLRRPGVEETVVDARPQDAENHDHRLHQADRDRGQTSVLVDLALA